MPPLLLLHGAGGGGWEWTRWQAVLDAEGLEHHAPDLQPAAAGIEATGWDDYVAQARAACDRLAAPPVLVGASLGGLLALTVAAQRPAAALVLINPLPPAPEAGALPQRPPYPRRVRWRSRARLAGTRAAMADADDAACLFAFRRWRDESGAVLEAARAGIAIDLAAITAPALVIASAEDDDVPPALSAQLAQRLRADLVGTAGGHLGPLLGRRAATVATTVIGWLRGRL